MNIFARTLDALKFGEITLQPGDNRVTAEQLVALKADKDFQKSLADGLVRFPKPDPESVTAKPKAAKSPKTENPKPDAPGAGDK